MAKRNPFTPTFGAMPPCMAGRELILRSMAQAFDNGPGDPNLSSILIGARGTGKTALLGSIAEEARQRGWVVASVTAIPGMLEDIIERAIESAEHIVDAQPDTKVSGVTIGPIGITLERARKKEGNWRTRMNAILDELARADSGLLILVDEVRADNEEMVQLAAVYQHFVMERRQAALVMAGLPYQTSSLVSDKAVSFLRRSRQHQLGRIADADVADALRQSVEDAGGTIDDAAVTHAVDAIGGFAFMMQLVGYWSWSQSDDGRIDCDAVEHGVRLARQQMREGVYEETYRELSKGDIRFLKALADCGGAATLAEVAERLDKPSNYASKYKTRLLKAGVIGDSGHNNLRVDIPGFLEFIAERVK